MRAIHIGSPGPPETLRLVEVPYPTTISDGIGVEVAFAGINFWDIMQRQGQVPLPATGILGSEGSGQVTEIGSAADGFAVGDRVAWSKVPSSYSERVTASAHWFVHVPDSVSLETAASLMMQGTTAWYLAAQACPLKEGETAVVFAAAGGVGHLLSQLLALRGVRVIGVVSSVDKVAFASMYCNGGVVVDSISLIESIRRIERDGVSTVFDATGGPDALRDLALLRPRGKVVYYGTAGGPLPLVDLALLSAGSHSLSRVRGQDFLGTSDQWRFAAHEVLALAASGSLKSHLDSCRPLSEASEQHIRLEGRLSMGKLLLAASRS